MKSIYEDDLNLENFKLENIMVENHEYSPDNLSQKKRSNKDSGGI